MTATRPETNTSTTEAQTAETSAPRRRTGHRVGYAVLAGVALAAIGFGAAHLGRDDTPPRPADPVQVAPASAEDHEQAQAIRGYLSGRIYRCTEVLPADSRTYADPTAWPETRDAITRQWADLGCENVNPGGLG